MSWLPHGKGHFYLSRGINKTWHTGKQKTSIRSHIFLTCVLEGTVKSEHKLNKNLKGKNGEQAQSVKQIKKWKPVSVQPLHKKMRGTVFKEVSWKIQADLWCDWTVGHLYRVHHTCCLTPSWATFNGILAAVTSGVQFLRDRTWSQLYLYIHVSVDEGRGRWEWCQLMPHSMGQNRAREHKRCQCVEQDGLQRAWEDVTGRWYNNKDLKGVREWASLWEKGFVERETEFWSYSMAGSFLKNSGSHMLEDSEPERQGSRAEGGHVMLGHQEPSRFPKMMACTWWDRNSMERFERGNPHVVAGVETRLRLGVNV